MRQEQTLLGHVLKYALIAIFFVVDDEAEVVTWPFCRAKYGRKALTFLL